MRCECGIDLIFTNDQRYFCPNGLCFKKFEHVICPRCVSTTRKVDIIQERVGLYSFICTGCRCRIYMPVGGAPYSDCND